MNQHSARDMTTEPAWRGRLRLALLALTLLLGFIVATIERFRQESILPLWAPANETLGVFTRSISHSTHGVVERARRVDDLMEAADQLEATRRELTEARLQQQLLGEQVGRLQRLVGTGEWSAPGALQFIPSDVIAIHTQEGSAEVTINHGAQDRIQPRDPAVALGGLVGVVRSVGRDHARIQTLSDPGSVVGAVSRQGRARGVVRGRGRDKPLEFVTEDETQVIEPGAELITSGFENSIYPKGILIGKITSVDLNVYGIAYGVVKPAVTFDTIEEVLLVVPTERLTRAADDGTLPTTPTLGHYTIVMPLQGGATPEQATTETLATSATLQSIIAIMQTSPTLIGPPAPSTHPIATTATTPTTRTPPTARREEDKPTKVEDEDNPAARRVPRGTERSRVREGEGEGEAQSNAEGKDTQDEEDAPQAVPANDAPGEAN